MQNVLTVRRQGGREGGREGGEGRGAAAVPGRLWCGAADYLQSSSSSAENSSSLLPAADTTQQTPLSPLASHSEYSANFKVSLQSCSRPANIFGKVARLLHTAAGCLCEESGTFSKTFLSDHIRAELKVVKELKKCS